MIALRIFGAIVTSDDVVTVVVTPLVLIDLMKAKTMLLYVSILFYIFIADTPLLEDRRLLRGHS